MATKSTQHEPVMLHAEQNSPQKIWERQEGESAKWHWRFRNYLALGPKRSINAVYEAEQQQKAEPSRGRAGETWYNAAKKYQWQRRAEAWDREQDEQKAAIMRQIATRAAFVSRPFRIVALNNVVDTLSRQFETGLDPATFMAMVKTMQSLLQDIKEEVQEWNITPDASCDAAALDAYQQKQRRMQDLAEERELIEEEELDRKIQEHMRAQQMIEQLRRTNKQLGIENTL